MCLSRSSKLCCHPCIGYPSTQGCALKRDMPAPGMLRTAKFALQHGIQLVMGCLVKRLRDVQHCVWAQGLPANFFLKLKVCRPFHVHVLLLFFCFFLSGFLLSCSSFLSVSRFPCYFFLGLSPVGSKDPKATTATRIAPLTPRTPVTVDAFQTSRVPAGPQATTFTRIATPTPTIL